VLEGLVNSMLFAYGSRAATPLAACEVQGYAYDGKRPLRDARPAGVGDSFLAERLNQQAPELRRRLNEDFWMPER
jgi:glycogen debranching enzyme